MIRDRFWDVAKMSIELRPSYPPYCYIYDGNVGKKLYFNTKRSSWKTCDSESNCICRRN